MIASFSVGPLFQIVEHIQNILGKYETGFGQHVNNSKTQIFISPNTKTRDIHQNCRCDICLLHYIDHRFIAII